MDDKNWSPDPGLELQLLSLSAPAARANVMRYMMAFRLALTGRLHDSDDLKVMVGAGFGVSDASEQQYQLLTKSDGCDRLYLRFNVDDAAGPPDGLGLFRKEGDAVPLYGQCRLWAPTGGGRPVIIFYHEGQMGHFTYRPGETLRRMDHLPCDRPMPGYLRADARLAKLVASERLREFDQPIMFMMRDPDE